MDQSYTVCGLRATRLSLQPIVHRSSTMQGLPSGALSARFWERERGERRNERSQDHSTTDCRAARCSKICSPGDCGSAAFRGRWLVR